MNAYDSTRMLDLLAPLGYRPVDKPDSADLIILNTCHIREKASDKVYSELGRLRQIKRERSANGDQLIIGVAGCVAQAEGAEIIRRAPYVDMVFGPQTYHRLPEMVMRAQRSTETGQRKDTGLIDTEFPAIPKFDFLPAASNQGASAFLTVQEGCDRFCSFCVVPYTRGAEYSRPVSDIVGEARELASHGAREITLLGQNVNAYHGVSPGGREWRLAALIHELADIEGIARLRYITSHPRDMTPDLITAHEEIDKLMPYLHLPVQSGSDRILKMMNRQHNADEYLMVVNELRAKRPDLALSSDFIVGHPGETEEDFEKTLTLIRRVVFAQAYSFKYSLRPGTPASTMGDAIPDEVKVDRLTRLQALLNDQQQRFNAGFVGKVVPVLLDRRGRDAAQLVGRSPWMQAVHVDFDRPAEANAAFGRLATVHVIAAYPNSLAGTPVTPATIGEPVSV